MTEDARRRFDAAPDASDAPDPSETREQVSAFYGREVARAGDLRTDAACGVAPDPKLARLIAKLHPETRERFFGCGLIAPEGVEGARILDLGCGAGRDVYVLAQMAGEDGWVLGVDMTPEQLEIAERHKSWHMAAFGFDQPNVSFRQGYLEHLDHLPVAPGGFDVAVSNCVLNLVTDKAATLAGVRRHLVAGGEFYFADVYADRALPPEIARDPDLYGECLGGALYWRRFLDLARATGFATPRLVEARPLSATDPALAAKLGGARFVSATYRLFAIDAPAALRSAPGWWAARYRGGVPGAEKRFRLDWAHTFRRGESLILDDETAAALSQSRFAPFFDFAPAEAAPNLGAAHAHSADRLAHAASPFALIARDAGGCGAPPHT